MPTPSVAARSSVCSVARWIVVECRERPSFDSDEDVLDGRQPIESRRGQCHGVAAPVLR